MKVFAVVPVFNRLLLTRQVVECLRQQRDVDLQIVVVDDGSTDGTAEYLAAQPDIIAIPGSGDLWWAGAVQLALRRILPHGTNEDYVLLVNDDTSFGTDFVARLLQVSRELGAAVVGGVLRNRCVPHELLSIGPRIDKANMEVEDILHALPAAERRAPQRIYEVDALPGRGTLYPVAAFRRAGLLRPRLLPHYMADYELAVRARRHGFRTVVATEAVVYTDNNFGSQRQSRSWMRRAFSKGSSTNLLHRFAFRLLVGWPYGRPALAPVFVLKSILAPIWSRLWPPVRRRLVFASFVVREIGRAPNSGSARARILLKLWPRIDRGSYTALHAYRAGKCIDVYGGKVLVVGCNTGKDCAYFVRLGAAEVHGVDVIEEVGSEYRHPRVRYLRTSAEEMCVDSGMYDLVFCFATLEHVPDIASAIREMARVTRENGVVYCVASPLWNSPFGHHKGDLFGRFPWIHLRKSASEVLEICRQEGIVDPSGRHPIDVHVDYMFDRRYFNRTPAARYVEVCAGLPDFEVVENNLVMDDDEILTPELSSELALKGYGKEELLAVTHTFIGRKNNNARRVDEDRHR